MVTLILLFSESAQSTAVVLLGRPVVKGLLMEIPLNGMGVTADELCSVQRGTELVSSFSNAARTFHRLPHAISGGGALIRSLGQSALYRLMEI